MEKLHLGEGIYVHYDGDRYEISANNDSEPLVTLTESMVDKLELFIKQVKTNFIWESN